ncbi:DUF2946 family protein [Asaia lannensis]|uniref:DUF2946 family protein n=1 Tax=Asaia lannensis TaxID=415421 RepID=UPI001C994E11
MAMIVLSGFVASLGLQSLARPDETPRAEIERLIGVDIAPAMTVPAMLAMGMIMPDDMSQCDHDVVPTGQGQQHASKAHHHHDDACALCPLLQLAMFILGVTGFTAFYRSIRLSEIVVLPQGRAPPGLRWVLPPSQGPPPVPV